MVSTTKWAAEPTTVVTEAMTLAAMAISAVAIAEVAAAFPVTFREMALSAGRQATTLVAKEAVEAPSLQVAEVREADLEDLEKVEREVAAPERSPAEKSLVAPWTTGATQDTATPAHKPARSAAQMTADRPVPPAAAVWPVTQIHSPAAAVACRLLR
jgi:hypothetical protein